MTMNDIAGNQSSTTAYDGEVLRFLEGLLQHSRRLQSLTEGVGESFMITFLVFGTIALLLNTGVISVILSQRHKTVERHIFYLLVLNCSFIDLLRGITLIYWGGRVLSPAFMGSEQGSMVSSPGQPGFSFSGNSGFKNPKSKDYLSTESTVAQQIPDIASSPFGPERWWDRTSAIKESGTNNFSHLLKGSVESNNNENEPMNKSNQFAVTWHQKLLDKNMKRNRFLSMRKSSLRKRVPRKSTRHKPHSGENFWRKVDQLMSVLAGFCRLTTVLNILLLTLNEFLYVRYSLHYWKWITRTRALVSILFCWVFAAIFAASMLIVQQLAYQPIMILKPRNSSRSSVDDKSWSNSNNVPTYNWTSEATAVDVNQNNTWPVMAPEERDEQQSGYRSMIARKGLNGRRDPADITNALDLIQLGFCFMCLIFVMTCYISFYLVVRRVQEQDRALRDAAMSSMLCRTSEQTLTTEVINVKRLVPPQQVSGRQGKANRPKSWLRHSNPESNAIAKTTLARNSAPDQNSVNVASSSCNGHLEDHCICEDASNCQTPSNTLNVNSELETLSRQQHKQHEQKQDTRRESGNKAQNSNARNHHYPPTALKRNKFVFVIGLVIFVYILYLISFSAAAILKILYVRKRQKSAESPTTGSRNSTASSLHMFMTPNQYPQEVWILQWVFKLLGGLHAALQPLCYFRMAEFRRLAKSTFCRRHPGVKVMTFPLMEFRKTMCCSSRTRMKNGVTIRNNTGSQHLQSEKDNVRGNIRSVASSNSSIIAYWKRLCCCTRLCPMKRNRPAEDPAGYVSAESNNGAARLDKSNRFQDFKYRPVAKTSHKCKIGRNQNNARGHENVACKATVD